mmetsp:Transcript_27528/g.79384  ORF Transcript_27528/g.79384 Transcript_27528/m.79384 type:complete len:251 (+) Transcript_27528:3753-4505(+)
MLAIHPFPTLVSLPLCPLAQRIVASSPFQVAVLPFVGTEGVVVLLPQLIIVILLRPGEVVRCGFGGVLLVVAYVVIDVILESRHAFESLVTIRTLVVVLFDVSPRVAIWQTESLCEGLSFSGTNRIGLIFLLLVFASARSRGFLRIVAVVGIDISLVILLPSKANTVQLSLPLVSERGAFHSIRDEGSKRISLTIDPQPELGCIATGYFAVTILQLKFAQLVKHNVPKLLIVRPTAASSQVLKFLVAGVR